MAPRTRRLAAVAAAALVAGMQLDSDEEMDKDLDIERDSSDDDVGDQDGEGEEEEEDLLVRMHIGETAAVYWSVGSLKTTTHPQRPRWQHHLQSSR